MKDRNHSTVIGQPTSFGSPDPNFEYLGAIADRQGMKFIPELGRVPVHGRLFELRIKEIEENAGKMLVYVYENNQRLCLLDCIWKPHFNKEDKRESVLDAFRLLGLKGDWRWM